MDTAVISLDALYSRVLEGLLLLGSVLDIEEAILSCSLHTPHNAHTAVFPTPTAKEQLSTTASVTESA